MHSGAGGFSRRYFFDYGRATRENPKLTRYVPQQQPNDNGRHCQQNRADHQHRAQHILQHYLPRIVGEVFHALRSDAVSAGAREIPRKHPELGLRMVPAVSNAQTSVATLAQSPVERLEKLPVNSWLAIEPLPSQRLVL